MDIEKFTDVMATTPQPQSKDAAIEKFTIALSTFRREMIDTMKDVASIAEKGPSYLLLGLGTAILLLALFCKLRPFGVQLCDLHPSEFITVALIAMILLLAGTALRIYQYKVEQEIAKEVRQTGARLMETAVSMIQAPPGGGQKTNGL